jgi:hypothetical protein
MALTGRRWLYGCGILSLLTVVSLIALVCWWNYVPAYQPPEKTFDGSSADLRQTVIVPTLDTPIPEGKSAIWCASFQLAWNELKTNVAHGPVQIEGAQDVADHLNRAEQSGADLAPESYYAVAGFLKDGVREQIARDMAARFPKASVPAIPEGGDGAVAYGFLSAGVKYTERYTENPHSFLFKDPSGKETPVRSFGVLEEDYDKQRRLRDQIEVLFANASSSEWPRNPVFAVDLSKNTAPNQLVLARVEPKPTLAETLADLQGKTAQWTPDAYQRKFGYTDCLLVPTMHWRIEHHFTELEGQERLFLNPNLKGLYSAIAMQTIELRLDRDGAEVSSFGFNMAGSARRLFYFDRPFLIYLKKRNSENPFFVMWVNNPELLCRPNAPPK